MAMFYPKKRPLSRYLKDFKHSQTHCAQCRKLLDRITLVHAGEIVTKNDLARLDTLIDEESWLEAQKEWVALCRFCGDLHCKERDCWFNIIGFKQYLFEQTDMSFGTIREYIVRLRRLGSHLEEQGIAAYIASNPELVQILDPFLPSTSTNNYRIALRKYGQYIEQIHSTV